LRTRGRYIPPFADTMQVDEKPVKVITLKR